MAAEIETHPVQTRQAYDRKARVPKVVSLRAYEAYCRLYGEQKEIVTGSCRGGFGVNELIGLLYAMTFPETEWRQRLDEALTGMENL